MKLAILLVLFITVDLVAVEPPPNILVYGEGTVQVDAEISEYENLMAGAPIKGLLMITHNAQSKIDANSFRIGDKPLEVTLAKSIPMSDSNPLLVSIYQFQLDGMPNGNHTLPTIKVKVGGKDYQAPPLIVQIGS